MTGVLLQKGEETQREDSNVKTETQIRVTMPQTKGYLETQRLETSR